MCTLAFTVAAVLILSSMLVFGEPFQSGTGVSSLNADHTTPTVSAPPPHHPPVVIPKTQPHHVIRCKLKIQINDEVVVITVPISEPKSPMLFNSPHIRSCAAIQTNCPSLVVAVPTSEGGICCQNGKNQLHLCAGLDLRFLAAPEWKVRLLAAPVFDMCTP
jgi:hypothetical protein